MTRLELEQAIYRRLGKNTSSVDTATQTRIRHFVNRRYRRLMGRPGLPTLFEDTTEFASVASQSRYALAGVERIVRLRETTNNRTLYPMSLDQYRLLLPDPTLTSGTPSHYVPAGFEFVAQQPSNASELWLDSTSAGDTQVAYVEGFITGGYPRSASVTLTGTTALTLSSSITTWERITKFYLASAAVGVVTLLEDSGTGTELARIGIGQTAQRYLITHLYPTPSAAITYDGDVHVPLTNLAQDTDEPRLPERFHDLLELGGAMDELVKTDDPRYRVWKDEYDELMGDYDYWVAVQMLSPHPIEPPSQLGAWFPSGT